MKSDLISRRNFLAAAGVAGIAAALTACGGAVSSTASSAAASSEAASFEAAGESVELIVFAAASLTETLNAIAQDYSAENPGVTFRFNFDSSGTLKTQIQEGADCDLFISAGQKQMNQLDITASLAKATVSQHLKELKEAGLIQGEIEAPKVPCHRIRTHDTCHHPAEASCSCRHLPESLSSFWSPLRKAHRTDSPRTAQ